MSGSGIFAATGTTFGWDIDTARIELGLDAESGDSGQDAAIQRVLDYVMAALEKVLQRGIVWDMETQRLYDPPRAGVKQLLYRYPIIDVFEVDGAAPGETLVTNPDRGWVRQAGWPLANGESAITYEGGYAVLPPDLERALWEMVRYVWSKSNPSTGGAETALSGSGDVKSLTVFDAFRVEYNVGSGGSAAASSLESIWGWMAPWAWTLELYRSEAGTWVG